MHVQGGFSILSRGGGGVCLQLLSSIGVYD